MRTIFFIIIKIPIFYCQYQIPQIKFEAFNPKGLTISIPAEDGLERFIFHGKVNKEIEEIEPGDINEDIGKSENGKFSFKDTEIQLKIGDIINYWVYVQHNKAGHRKDGQTFKINELLPLEMLQNGKISATKVELDSHTFITDELIFQDNFAGKIINENNWIIEEYIPGDPNWEYNIYQNSSDVIFANNNLFIKPKIELSNANKNLDLGLKCTRNSQKECSRKFFTIWNPPVISGQLRLKKSFFYGNITIRAKLPIGDYVYPEIYLQDSANINNRILIAYARGNRNYEKNGIDEGGSRLFAGPDFNIEPGKISLNRKFRTYKNSEHIGEKSHLFKLLWTSEYIKVYFDDKFYGEYESSNFKEIKMVNLVIGVGIGGPYEFPDYFTSSGISKPYQSTSSKQIKTFTQNAEIWQKTWSDLTQLEISEISIRAV